MSGGVVAVVLAAGASRRMAPANKLLLHDGNGVTMVGRVAQACCASRVNEVIVVVGHAADAVMQAVRVTVGDAPVRFVRVRDHALGMSASLRAGLAVVGEAAAALVCLGDMPLVHAGVMDRVLAGYVPAAGALVVVPVCAGQRGNPVLWDRCLFAEMMTLTGDAGARGLLRVHAGWVREVAVDDPAVLRDFDTPASMANGF